MNKLIVLCITLCLEIISLPTTASEPWFITDLTFIDSQTFALICKGDQNLKFITPSGKIIQQLSLPGSPTGICNRSNQAFVTTTTNNSQLTIVDLITKEISKTFTFPNLSGACSPILSTDGKSLYFCTRFTGEVVEVNLSSGEILRRCKMLREPVSALLSPDGSKLFVTNFLPAQRADVDHVASSVSVIDIATFKRIKDIRLENGSNALRGLSFSPDNHYLFISHNLGRYTVPTSQLQQGWMNTSALSVIDVNNLEFIGALLVDEAERGAAGVWGVACDKNNIYVSHSGVHEISVIDYKAFRKKFEAYPDKKALNYDLRFLYGIRKRISIQGNGPRNFIIANGEIIIPTYFSDHLNRYSIANAHLETIALNPHRKESPAQEGERMFNDATYCFQNWQSCNGCHPGDARSDGMNWDLMNDGVGNSKNCKSLLLSIETPPSMISGIRKSAQIANRAGFKFIQFHEISEEEGTKIDAYIQSLKPIPSPYLVDGVLSEKAQKGRKLFHSLRCDECHSGPYYTNQQSYLIGEDVEFEQGWDTPTLIEVWRTAPYLFDGRAARLEEVFRVHKHGIKKKLSRSELENLVEYVNSL